MAKTPLNVISVRIDCSFYTFYKLLNGEVVWESFGLIYRVCAGL
jgi:hypothetical protein